MKRDLFPRPFVRPLALLLCGLLASCGRPDITTANPTPTAALAPSANSTAAAAPNLSNTVVPPPTATLTGPQLDATTTVNEAIMRHAAETARALSPVPDLNWIPPTPESTPKARVQTGILDSCEGSSENSHIAITNCWINVINGEYVWVDAGSADTSTGRIGVITYTLNFSYESAEKYYDAPQAKGAVTISAVNGSLVVLQYPDGSTVSFDVLTRTWIDQHGPLPTLTPTVTIPTPTATTPTPGGTEPARSVVIEKRPLLFEPNVDRYDPSVQYLTHSLGGVVTFSPDAVVMTLPILSSAAGPRNRIIETGPIPSQQVRLTFVGANPTPTIAPLASAMITLTLASGMDPAKWKRIPTYLGIVYQALYPGIDLRYEGHDKEIKSTYSLAAGANPDQIRLRYEGVDRIAIDLATGELQLTLPPATTNAPKPKTIIESAPIAWQAQGDTRVPVTVQYVLNADSSVGFALGSYDHAAALTIDPTIRTWQDPSTLPSATSLPPSFLDIRSAPQLQ